MAFIFGDSFDFYTPLTNTAGAEFTSIGPWTSVPTSNLNISSTVTRFNAGKAIGFVNGGSVIQKSLAANTSNTAFAAFATFTAAPQGSNTIWNQVFLFEQNTFVQVGIAFRSDGAITVYRATNSNQALPNTGTVIATFPAAWTANVWTHWQIKVVFHASAGSVTLRKNGDSADTFVATGLNTMQTANAYCDGVRMGIASAPNAGNAYFDDVMVWDNSGAAPNDWVGDIRAYTLSPSADTSQKDFSQTPITQTFADNSQTIGATTTTYFTPFTPTYSGKLTKVELKANVAATANVRLAVYNEVGGVPTGSPVTGTTTTLANPATGYNAFTLATPMDVVAGTQYWIAVQQDAAVAWLYNSLNGTGKTQAQTYASGMPSPVGTLASGTANFANRITITVANFNAVSQTTPDGDTTYNYSSTVGALDLFNIAGLPSTPSVVYAVTVKAMTRKSDASARSAQIAVKSGATSALGVSTPQSTSYTALTTTYLTDPNTSAAWTAAAVNALQVGVKVSA